MCEQLDWQIDCAAQICGALITAASGVGGLTLELYDKTLPSSWHNGGIDGTTWHELLRSFNGVKVLHVYGGLLEELSRALQLDEVGSEPGFLPDLQHIIAERNLFTSFIDTRRVVGRSVQFSLEALSPSPSPTRVETGFLPIVLKRPASPTHSPRTIAKAKPSNSARSRNREDARANVSFPLSVKGTQEYRPRRVSQMSTARRRDGGRTQSGGSTRACVFLLLALSFFLFWLACIL
jgi:hypothetical protein